MTVLLVEDNPGDARLVRELLTFAEAVQFDATWVKSLTEARENLAKRPYDVILLDLGLPESTGIDTLRAIRNDTDAPIVVLTGLDDQELGLKMVKEGCQDYLVKGRGDEDLIQRTLLYAIERKRTEDALRKSEERYRDLIEITPDAIILASEHAGIIYVNPAARKLFGADTPDELLGRGLSDLIDKGDRDAFEKRVLSIFKVNRSGFEHVDLLMSDLDGNTFDAEVAAVPMEHEGAMALQFIIRDVTELREIERRQRLAAAVFETSGEAMMIVDADNLIIAVNPAFTEITGYNPEDVLGQDPGMLSSGRHDQGFYDAMWKTLEEDMHWRGEMWNRRKDGELYVQRATISEILDEHGRVSNYVCVFTDITQEKAEAEVDRFRATHDALTKLPNRLLLADRIQHAIRTAIREKSAVALLFIDLDGFKPINDTKGHLVGDLVLQAVADRLRHSGREGDTVARIGGDEFVVVADVTHARHDAVLLAEKMLQIVPEPIIVGDDSVQVGCSIGIAVFPDHGDAVEELIHRADIAMYWAKRAGKGQYAFYDPAKDEGGIKASA